ncbi:hypothetical protein FTO60_10190 [Octadecabacter sp. SW4]|uniref:hypothetical protein n=1 Tax=Octadecabacter sp. SW4 TaxID=2602067 RepID=UPI0011C1E0AF|nr:hypothetical protein [Octadecabacter sp. SW4]QEE36048.1 hypothetical protein FTO60_10190 [Octadecabacter sp. SW4]
MTRTVLITGARAPTALHLARLLHDAGQRVVLADSLAHPFAARSAAIARYVRLPAPRFDLPGYAAALRDLIGLERVDLVIPTCEEVFYLGQIWADMPCPLFAPPMARLRDAHDKYTFMMQAAAMGLDVPDTHLIRSRDDLAPLRNLAGEFVFKPVWSRFAAQILIRPKAQALDRIMPDTTTPWIAQAFVSGQEICAYALAVHGKLTALAQYTTPYRAGRGAGTYLRPVDDPAVRHFVQTYVTHTGWHGQISFDFIRGQDGTALPLECNPRATSGVHFFRDGRAVSRALEGQMISADVTTAQTLPLAMWVYGLRPRALGRFWHDLRAADNFLSWPGDPAPSRGQWRAFAEIAAIAWRHRISLLAATTHDIEWNGPAQDTDQSAI